MPDDYYARWLRTEEGLLAYRARLDHMAQERTGRCPVCGDYRGAGRNTTCRRRSCRGTARQINRALGGGATRG